MTEKPRLHAVRVEVPYGRAILGRVFVDDRELRGVTRVRFDTGDDVGGGFVTVTLSLFVDHLELVGDSIVVLEPAR